MKECKHLKHHMQHALGLLHCVKPATLQLKFYFRDEENFTGDQIQPTLVTSYDPQYESWVALGLLMDMCQSASQMCMSGHCKYNPASVCNTDPNVDCTTSR